MAKRSRRPPQLRQTTVRDFSGGLNIIDNELNLDPRFCVVLDNVARSPDASLTPRYGKRLFCNLRNGVTADLYQLAFLKEDNTNAAHELRRAVTTVVGRTYRFEAIVRAHGRTRIALNLPASQFGSLRRAYYELIGAGTVVATVGSSVTSITKLANGLYLCVIEAVATIATTSNFLLYLDDNTGAIIYTGDNVSGVDVHSLVATDVTAAALIWTTFVRDFANAAWTKGASSIVSSEITITTAVGSTLVTVTHTAHGLTSGMHVRFADLQTLGGVPADELNRLHGIHVVDANTYTFHVRTEAAAIVAVAQTALLSTDTHILAGDTVEGTYFQNYLIVFDAIGEIAMVDASSNATRIWSHHHAQALSGSPAPWRWCTFITLDTSKAKLLAVNSYDKPVEIDTGISPVAQFYVDPADGSNGAIPVGRLIKSHAGYVCMVTLDEQNVLRFSAKNAAGVFSGSVDPSDALDVDATQIATVINPKIVALNVYRDKFYVAFQNSSLLADLGIYNGDAHDPQFADTLSTHGTVSHRTTVAIGNDLFALDYSGVPSVTTSMQSGQFMPDRVSDLVEPMIQRHMSRLSDETLEEKTFAVWNPRQRQYMVFVPKYDENDVRNLLPDPLYTTIDMVGQSWMMLNVDNHNFGEGDQLTISGVNETVGGVSAANINGVRTVRAVVNEDYVIINVGANVLVDGQNGGGDLVSVAPINDETITYVYTYYPKLKVRAWSRFRGWQVNWATTSLLGRVFLGWQGKVYLYGADSDPFFADDLDDYDFGSWANSTEYTAGNRVLDTNNGVVYSAATTHTSAASGSFADARAANTALWVPWTGYAISWVAELPWADFDKRWPTKHVRHIHMDTKGFAQFSVELFVDNLYRSRATYIRSPARAMTFTGGDAGGFGAGPQPFGGGRQTREQLLWAMPLRARLLKVRFSGQTTEALRIVGVSFTYHEGSIHR